MQLRVATVSRTKIISRSKEYKTSEETSGEIEESQKKYPTSPREPTPNVALRSSRPNGRINNDLWRRLCRSSRPLNIPPGFLVT